jgi:hypothetical protein
MPVRAFSLSLDEVRFEPAYETIGLRRTSRPVPVALGDRLKAAGRAADTK